MLKQAVAAHANGDMAAAEVGYRLAAERGEPEAAFQLGLILSDKGDDIAAAEAYERAAETGHPEAALNLAMLYAETLDRPEHAWRLLERQIACGDRRAMFDLGYLRRGRKDYAGAADAFQRAIEAGDPRGHLEMGFLLADDERDEEALAAFEEAAMGGVDEALTQAGWQLARLGRLNEAETMLRRARERGDLRAGGILADVLDKLSHPDEAAAIRAEANEWAKRSVSLDYRVFLVELDGEKLDAEGLEAWLAEEVTSETAIELAALLYDSARLAEAETRLGLALEYGDESASPKLIRLYDKTGRHRQAESLRAKP